MPRRKREVRNDRLYCPGCRAWLHYSKFSPKRQTDHGTVVQFHARCRHCEQSERDDQKNESRALVKIKASARTHSREWNVTADELLIDLGWAELEDWVEACIQGQAKCINCLHPFTGPDDVQIDIRDPVQHPDDTARMHVRNVGPLCRSCNNRKSNKPYTQWLDEEEDARRSVIARYSALTLDEISNGQGSLFA